MYNFLKLKILIKILLSQLPMTKSFLAVRKDTIITDNLKNFYFVFGDQASLIHFKELNKFQNVKTFIYDEIPSHSNVFINEGLFFQILAFKLLKRGIKNIYIYSNKNFPKKVKVIFSLNRQKSKYEIIKNIIFIEDYLQSSALLAYNLMKIKNKFDIIALKNSNKKEKLYEFSKLIKEVKGTFKIVLYGMTSTPKRDLMTNSIDFVLIEEKYIFDLKNNLNNLSKIKSLYYYDKNFSVVFNK